METYTVIKKGKSVKRCLNIPSEFINKELEITIKPVRSGGKIRKKIETIMGKYQDIKPFESISDPVKWQRKTRSEW